MSGHTCSLSLSFSLSLHPGTMNVFRLLADLMHLASIFILLLKIQNSKSCVGKYEVHFYCPLRADMLYVGISFKTQMLYTIVFMTRYLDLTFHFISLYNTCMKIFFIASSVYILYLMRVKYKASYDPGLDTFRFEYLLGFAMLLGVAFSYDYTPVEVKGSLKSIKSASWIDHA